MLSRSRWLAVHGALLCTALFPAVSRGQTQTQQIGLILKVPFTVRTLDPAIHAIRLNCMAWIHAYNPSTTHTTKTSVGNAQSAQLPFRELQRGTDGSYSGEADVTVAATIPGDAAGKTGSIDCNPEGCLSGGAIYYGSPCGPLGSSNVPDPRLAAQRGGNSYVEFKW